MTSALRIRTETLIVYLEIHEAHEAHREHEANVVISLTNFGVLHARCALGGKTVLSGGYKS